MDLQEIREDLNVIPSEDIVISEIPKLESIELHQFSSALKSKGKMSLPFKNDLGCE